MSRPARTHRGAPGPGSGSVLGQQWRRWLCWPFCPGGHRRKRSSTLMARLQASAQVILVSVAGEVLTSLEAAGCAWISATIPAYPVSSVCVCLLASVSQAFRSFCPGQQPNRKSQCLRLVAFQGSCASAGAELRDGGGQCIDDPLCARGIFFYSPCCASEWASGHLLWTVMSTWHMQTQDDVHSFGTRLAAIVFFPALSSLLLAWSAACVISMHCRTGNSWHIRSTLIYSKDT